MTEAFKAPFALLDEILSALDRLWPALQALLDVVRKHESKVPGVKRAMCLVQEKFFRGLKTVCGGMNSAITLVGSKLDTLVILMDHAADKVDCQNAGQAIKDRRDQIVKKLQNNTSEGVFATCAYEPVLTDCPDGSKGEENSRTFMDDIFEFGQLLIKIAKSAKDGIKNEAADAVTALVAKISGAGAEIMQLSKDKLHSEIRDAVAPLIKLAKENPLATIAEAADACRPLIAQSASTVKDLINDLDKQFRRLRGLLSGSMSDPDIIASQLAEIFRDVGVLARRHTDIFLDEKVLDETWKPCEDVLQTLSEGAGGGAALAIFRAAKKVGSQLQNPMHQVAEVAEYVANALECGARLIPPIRRATGIILDLIQGGKFAPEIVEKAVAQVHNLFNGPLECVTTDITAPLEPLFSPYIDAALQSPYARKIQEEISSTKDYAHALGRAIASVQELAEAGMAMYTDLRTMISEVEKYTKAGSTVGVGPGLSTALSATRTFKESIVSFIGPLRELREVLQVFPLDESTLLNLLDAADHTLVGLEASCDVVVNLILYPPSKDASFLEMGLVKRSSRRVKSQGSRSQQTLQASFERAQNMARGPPEKSAATDSQRISEELLAKLTNVQEKLSSQNFKLDQLQEASDMMSAQMHVRSVGGHGDKDTARGSEKADSAEAKSYSETLLKSIENQQKKMKCPGTHTATGDGAIQKLLVEKDVEMLTESITVPVIATYGVVVKVGLLFISLSEHISRKTAYVGTIIRWCIEY